MNWGAFIHNGRFQLEDYQSERQSQKKTRSSKKAKEDAEDKVHYLNGVDEDDENEEGVDDEGSAELEEAIEQLLNNSNSAWSFINNALQSEPVKKEQ